MMLKWKKRRSVCVCSWCRAVIAINNYLVTGGESATTHGLCESCMSRMEARSFAPPASHAQARGHAV